jgi:glycosyltransferase involved in cell wall biosynthesis
MSGEIVSGIFNDSYNPITDGVAIVTKNYAYWLNRLAGPSCVITPDMPDYFDTEDFPVYRFPSMPLAVRPPYRVGVDFIGEVREKRLRGINTKEVLRTNLFNLHFDIIHTHSPFSSGNLAYRLARKWKIPLVTTFHTKYREDFMQAMKSKILVDIAIRQLVAFYGKADYVWVPSEETIETLRSYGFKGPIEVMPNGTDLIIAEDALKGLRREGEKYFGIPQGMPMLLYIGQHIKEKNLDVIINSLGVLHSKGVDFRMVFIGGGYYADALKEKVRERGLDKKVLFKGIIRDRAIITQAYARADLLYFPSLYDTSSLIVKESAGMRLPALLVSGSSTAAGIKDGENGFLAGNSAEDMAAKLQVLLADPSLLTKAGQGAYMTLYRSWESVIGSVAKRYKEIIDSWVVS